MLNAVDRIADQDWADALRGARDCLDPERRHRGRHLVSVPGEARGRALRSEGKGVEGGGGRSCGGGGLAITHGGGVPPTVSWIYGNMPDDSSVTREQVRQSLLERRGME